MSRRWLARLAEPFRNEEFRELRKHLFPGDQLSLPAPVAILVSIAAVGLAVYTLYIAFHVTPGPVKTRAIHLAVTIPLTFLLYPALGRWRDRSPRILDYVLAALAAAAFIWAYLSANRFEARFAYYDPVLPTDFTMGVIAILVIFEATRRTVGMSIVILNGIFITYALTGPYWPGLLAHKGTSVPFLIEHLYMLSDGIFNFIMGIMATFLFTFLMFGAFLMACGGDRIFNNLAMALAGHRRGGPAKVAVVSSGMMGMLSGSTVSNVATTGTLTIPLMKKSGYRDFEAGAIESVASVGGALTPPLMGAGVFIMSAFTGKPLGTILLYSIAPAFLYFAALYFYVDAKARKRGLRGLPRDTLPDFWGVLWHGGHIFIPVAVLIGLLILKYSTFYASSACVVMIFVVSWLRKDTRLTLPKLWIALEAGTRIAITVASLSASAAIIYGVITATGLLPKVSSIILDLSGGSLFFGIVLIALMSYVMGMGLPVTASYVLLAALGAPALQDLGLSILAAHLIIFWFSQDSTITPPICMTAFVAARIANSPPMRTGWEAVKLAKALYIIPFVFAFGSLLDQSIAEILFDTAALIGAFACLPVALEGFHTRRIGLWERACFAAIAACLIAATFGPAESGWPWLLPTAALCALVSIPGVRRRLAQPSLSSDESAL